MNSWEQRCRWLRAQGRRSEVEAVCPGGKGTRGRAALSVRAPPIAAAAAAAWRQGLAAGPGGGRSKAEAVGSQGKCPKEAGAGG